MLQSFNVYIFLSLLHSRSPVTIAAGAIYFATLALDIRTSAKGVLPYQSLSYYEYSYNYNKRVLVREQLELQPSNQLVSCVL